LFKIGNQNAHPKIGFDSKSIYRSRGIKERVLRTIALKVPVKGPLQCQEIEYQ